jgi:hypothetical protein
MAGVSARSENEQARIVIPAPSARRSEGCLGSMAFRNGSMGLFSGRCGRKTDSAGRLVVLELARSLRVMKKAKLPILERSGSELNQECSFGPSLPEILRRNFNIIKSLMGILCGFEVADTVH